MLSPKNAIAQEVVRLRKQKSQMTLLQNRYDLVNGLKQGLELRNEAFQGIFVFVGKAFVRAGLQTAE